MMKNPSKNQLKIDKNLNRKISRKIVILGSQHRSKIHKVAKGARPETENIKKKVFQKNQKRPKNHHPGKKVAGPATHPPH